MRRRLIFAALVLALLLVPRAAESPAAFAQDGNLACAPGVAVYEAEGWCIEGDILAACEFWCAMCGSSGTTGGICSEQGGSFRLACLCAPIIEGFGR